MGRPVNSCQEAFTMSRTESGGTPGELTDQPIDEFRRGAGLIIRSRFHVINL